MPLSTSRSNTNGSRLSNYTNSIVHVPTSIKTVLLVEDDVVDGDRRSSIVTHPKFYDYSAKHHLLYNKMRLPFKEMSIVLL